MMPAYDSLSEFNITKFLNILYPHSRLEFKRDKNGYLTTVNVYFNLLVIDSFHLDPNPGSTEQILFSVLNKANKINAKLESALSEYYRS
jgi:hypothetical protein